jgi:predicted nuclease of predicted toxin-antitoxin system
MDLLFDENISFKIVKQVVHVFPNAKHVREINLINIEDKTIFQYAKENDFCIVSFDEDFNNLSLINGYPPKVIWLRTGNSSTHNLVNLLILKSNEINAFLSPQNEYGCLEIY